VELYRDEKAGAEEVRRVMWHFRARVRRPAQCRQLVAVVEELQ
jgi:hypothetical protein